MEVTMAQHSRSTLLFLHLEDKIREIIKATDPFLIEIQNSLGMVIVGVVFILGGDHMYRQNASAWQMFEILSPIWWGLIYTSAGVSHLMLLKWRREWLRAWVLLLKFALWMLLGTALLAGVGWFVPAVYIYYMFAVIAFRGYMKIQVGVNW